MKKEFLVLCGIMVALLSVSCGDESSSLPVGTDVTDKREGTSETVIETDCTYDIPGPDLPSLDYGGAVFRFMGVRTHPVNVIRIFYMLKG